MQSFGKILEEFCNMIASSPPTEKAVIHCSAGIGRTGTTVCLVHVILNIYAQINAGVKDPRFSVFSVVRRMREQRMGMVQMPEQYSFIYLFLYSFLQQKKLI